VGAQRFDGAIEGVLYRVAREAVAVARRSLLCKGVSVRLWVEVGDPGAARLSLEVRAERSSPTSGEVAVGDARQAPPSLQQLVALLDGDLEIRPLSAGGHVLRAAFPLAGRELGNDGQNGS
jgi:hypothetical protein